MPDDRINVGQIVGPQVRGGDDGGHSSIPRVGWPLPEAVSGPVDVTRHRHAIRSSPELLDGAPVQGADYVIPVEDIVVPVQECDGEWSGEIAVSAGLALQLSADALDGVGDSHAAGQDRQGPSSASPLGGLGDRMECDVPAVVLDVEAVASMYAASSSDRILKSGRRVESGTSG